jgi:hypothetical protein
MSAKKKPAKGKTAKAPGSSPPAEVRELVIFAWVGEDALGKEGFGIKQAFAPNGFIPLVTCREGALEQDYIREQVESMVKAMGKNVFLCRFKFDGVVAEVNL